MLGIYPCLIVFYSYAAYISHWQLRQIHTAHLVLSRYGVELTQQDIDIDEIQSEDPQHILKDKVAKAYELLKKPVLVSDDCWEIVGLKGFPRPYMKSINSWFTPQDMLRLTSGLKDRTIYLIQNVAFQDKDGVMTFTKKIPGLLLKEIKGSIGKANERTTSITPDGKSISEVYESNRSAISDLYNVWTEVGE